MKLSLPTMAGVTLAAATFALTGCSAPAGYSYKNITIGISATCSDCQAGQVTVTYNPLFPMPSVANGVAPSGSVILMPNAGQGGEISLTATVTNAPSNVTWTLYPTPNLTDPTAPTGTSYPVTESSSSVGTLTNASGNTVYYTQNGVPVYTGAALLQAQALGIPQGDVLLVASVPADPNNPSAVVTANQLIQIYGTTPTVYLSPRTPTTPSGLTNPVASVARNTQFAFYGGVVGATPCTTTAACAALGTNIPINYTDNLAQWFVGPGPCGTGAPPATAVLGGSTTYGTITQAGVYTAPAAIPATQPAVYVNAHQLASVSACANVAVQ